MTDRCAPGVGWCSYLDDRFWRKADIGLWPTSGLIVTVIRLPQYALGNGVTKDELAEVITTWAFDAGWICASMATGSARIVTIPR